MGWSTRQLADLTGVTLRSIRHWHQVGLLPEPSRLTNGYKQYTASHLVLALRIARLQSLGFSLEQVADMLASEEHGREALQDLRAELAIRIADLTRLQADVDAVIAAGVAPDLSPSAALALEALGPDPSSRNMAILFARLLPPDRMPSFADTMRRAPAELTQLNTELGDLPEDASDAQIHALADRGAEVIAAFLADEGSGLPDLDTHVGGAVSTEAMLALTNEHLHAAQRRVLARMVERLS